MNIKNGIVGGLMLLGVSGCCGGGSRDAGGTTGTSGLVPSPPEKVEKGPATEVDIKTLLKEYKDNEVRADGQFKDKYVQVTGKVGDIKKDITNSIYVTLGTGAAFEIPQVQCFFDDIHAQKAASLSKGATVTVKGRVSGLMMNVLVKDCEFVKLQRRRSPVDS